MTRKAKPANAGFTLLEMVVALSISSIVLIGVFVMLSSMVQYEVEGMRKGSVNAWSLASLVAMNGEIEAANLLAYPRGGSGANTLVVCSNWSRLMSSLGGTMNTLGGGAMNTLGGGAGVGPTVYSYCWDSTTNVLRRKVVAGACTYTVTSCDTTSYPGDSLIATGVYQDAANDPIFTADPAFNGSVRLRYVVGNPNAGASPHEGNGMTNFVNPQSMAFDTRLTLDKAFGTANTLD
jgi:prepilin-type N-terminal cleavage/methylation domain-containing protein